ncbi:Nitrogen permease regulator 2 [Podila epicladia]|nr:Nitrogen permease regulator 2 [Podila epicladia]KAG0097446.1 Nitrogen permease regulator 2 [Podila epicladia]
MGFPRLLSIFYCTFHPTQGPKVLYEVPEGSILSKTSPLVDFDSISEYLIPKVELCSKLVTISTPTCKVIGFPINLEHKKFQRNALMFNLAFVFDKDAEISSYEPVVRKMARVLKALEKESEFLSRQTRLAMMDNGTLANMTSVSSATTSSIPPSVPPSIPPSVPPSTMATTTGTSSTPPTSAAATPVTTTAGATTAVPTDPNSVTATATSMSNLSLDPVAKDASTSQGASSASNGLIVPVDPASPVTIPTSLSPAPVSVTSTALVSSPPAISGSSISTVLTAPPSSSPFPPSKPGTVPPSVNGGSTNPATKPPASSTLLQQNQIEHGSGMQNLIEQLIEDLNSYCECQIPIDSANTINLKLFPTYPNPAAVYDYQVPISTVNLEALIDVNWDMTMQRITGYINGVSSVKRIAEYADVETGLARMCMEHLLYYGCIIMVDLFQFKNIYAVKMEMMRLTEDAALQNECVAYVTLPDMHAPSFAKIFSLYCSLQYGVVLQDWIETNQIAEYNIDVRRFISFGVIKGFLYRVHKYPILDYHEPVTAATTPLNSKGEPTTSSNPSATTTNSASSSSAATPVLSSAPTPVPNALAPPPTLSIANGGEPQSQRKLYGDTLAPTDQSNYMTYSQHQQQQSDSGNSGANSSRVIIPPALRKLLDGQHHYDELCTQFGCSVREMDQILATDSRVKFIYR